MECWRGPEAIPGDWGRAVVTIGTFDGVHRGHQVIVARAVARARAAGQPAVALTFEPHPSEVIRPGSHPATLTDVDRKAELLAELGIDVLLIAPFTLEFSRLSPESFVRGMLVEQLHAAAVVVGANFRFGARAAGDVALLTRLGERYGFAVDGVPLVFAGASRYSSTQIRSLVAAGDVAGATAGLGRPHRVSGQVVRGDGRGRQLGYPTANLALAPYTALPADGVYAGRAVLPGGTGPAAAISVGTNPTFDGTERRVEAYLLDFDADLYGQRLGLDFLARLRGQVRYEQPAALAAQMAADVAAVRQLAQPGEAVG